MTQHTPDDLLDTDGENLAVRMFLAIYGTSSLTIQAMKQHLEYCGYPYWPEWADKYQASDTTHLTKLGAQNWIRHLFALEPDAIRALACVNALHDMDNEDIDEIRAWAHGAGIGMALAMKDKAIGEYQLLVSDMEKQRDELLDALKNSLHTFIRIRCYTVSEDTKACRVATNTCEAIVREIEEAIAKAGAE